MQHKKRVTKSSSDKSFSRRASNDCDCIKAILKKARSTGKVGFFELANCLDTKNVTELDQIAEDELETLVNDIGFEFVR